LGRQQAYFVSKAFTRDSAIVAPVAANQGKVAFGATVTVRHGNGDEATYHIVGVEGADPEHGSISWISPLARSLLSRRAGDKVRFRSPAGDEELTIATVRYAGAWASGGRALTSAPNGSIPCRIPSESPVQFPGLPRIEPRVFQVLSFHCSLLTFLLAQPPLAAPFSFGGRV
jgi:hypothetical protein